MAGRAREQHRAGLRDPRRAARTVDRERGRTARRQLAPQLHQRARAAARRRSARGAVAEAPDDAGDPLAVEILAGDDDDAAVAPEERGGQDAAVPEREDRLPAGRDDRFVVREAVDAPPIGRTERARSSEATAAASGDRAVSCSRSESRCPRFPCLDLHAFVAAARRRLRADPVDDLVRVHDVARLAVHAVRRVDLQLLACRRRRRPSRRRWPDRSGCTGCRTPRGSACAQTSASWTIRCDGWSSGCRVPE